jgi:hypothetical protein
VLELVIDEDEARARVFEDVADVLRVQAIVQRDEDAPGGRHAVVGSRRAGVFGAMNATRSPRCRPAACRAEARRLTRSPNSA